MKVHITLVGGQPAPVYNGIVATQPDKVIYIISKTSKEKLDRLLRVVHTKEYSSEILDETDPEKILTLAKQLAESYKNDEVTLNISSGLKSWSFLFGIVFHQYPNASVVYMDQNNILWNYRTMTASEDFTFDMKINFELSNNPLEYYTPFSDYTDADTAVLPTIEAARKYNQEAFKHLTQVLTKNQQKLIKDNPQCGFSNDFGNTSWKRNEFVKLCFRDGKKGPAEFLIESPHCVDLVFNSGWFEYKVAKMLSKWPKAKEIVMNCKFPPQKGKEEFPKNEIDVIVNTGSKLLFVECKTGVSDSLAIDKFKNAVRNYGGSASKALFFTENLMSQTQLEKCRESGITSFSLKRYPDEDVAMKELFALLDRNLTIINA